MTLNVCQLFRTLRRERRTLVVPRLGAGGRGLQGPFCKSGAHKCAYSGSSESMGGLRRLRVRYCCGFAHLVSYSLPEAPPLLSLGPYSHTLHVWDWGGPAFDPIPL